MNDQPNPQGINLLKELLFEAETRRLDDLARRIEAETTAAVARDKTLGEKLDVVFERAGTEEHLLHSVAAVIDGALREAEVSRHDALSIAIAPLVVQTIKNQLRDSQDEMVDALYPITGRLVKSYVQAEISKLMIEINARLGGARPAQLEAESTATGVSAGDLALAEANRLHVEELFLVRRGSGDLIAHWEQPDANTVPNQTRPNGASPVPTGSNRDALLSGYLSGIMALSEEAFGAAPGSFRTLTFADGGRIFVRGSAAHLLAVRCRGSAPAEIEQVVDEVFLDTLDRYSQVLAGDAQRRRANPTAGRPAPDAETTAAVAAILPAIRQSIEQKTQERREALARKQAASRVAGPSFGRVYALAALLAAPFVMWGVWSAYQSFETTRAENAAAQALDTIDEIKPMPPHVDVARGGRKLTLSGFVPSNALRDKVIARISEQVPQSTIVSQLGVIPQGSAEIEATLAQWQREAEQRRQVEASATVTRAISRVQQRLAPLRATVVAFQEKGGPAAPVQLSDLRRALDQATEFAAVGNDKAIDLPRLNGLWQSLSSAEMSMAALMGSTPDTSHALSPTPTDPRQLAEESSLLAERLAAAGINIPLPTGVASLARDIGSLSARLDKMPQPSAREQLDRLLRSAAVFFGNGADYRDESTATTQLDMIANALQQNPNVVLRVVGYTDDRGTTTLNTNLAQARADRVTTSLVQRGINANRIVAIGRLAAKDLSRETGVSSPNRRVEFEIGFPGETGGAP